MSKPASLCPKCHVILRLAKDDDEKPSPFDLRRLLRRKKVVVGLACATALVFAAFGVGLSVGTNRSQTHGNNRGIVMTSFGLFFAHNEVHVNDGPPKDEGAAPK